MAVKYKVVEMGNPGDQSAPKKFYARLVSNGEITLHSLSKEIAGRSSLTVGDVKNVIEQLIELIPQHLAEGKIVRLGTLGSISLTCSSEGKETAAKVNPSCIKSIKASYRPSNDLKSSLADLKFEKQS